MIQNTTWAKQLYQFYNHLSPLPQLPQEYDWLFPQKQPEVKAILKTFLDKYYNDKRKRTLLLGINPGRFGAGITGVNFTAPKQLLEICQIQHPFKNNTELSAEFVYKLIEMYGGPEKFYGDFFIGSVCPLGLIKNGKNINYYDDKALMMHLKPFIERCISAQASMPVNNAVCISIGGEKNFKFLSVENEKNGWFKKIVPLPHPRFIMQYKRKSLNLYLENYINVLSEIKNNSGY